MRNPSTPQDSDGGAPHITRSAAPGRDGVSKRNDGRNDAKVSTGHLTAAALALVLGFPIREARTQSTSCFISTVNGAIKEWTAASCAFFGVPAAPQRRARAAGVRRSLPPLGAWAILNATTAPNCPGFNPAVGGGQRRRLKMIIWRRIRSRPRRRRF
jgi:hypothetical protein